MKRATIIVLLSVGLLNQTSVHSKLVEGVNYKLRETPIKPIPLELKYELSLLQKNMKEYDKIIKDKVKEDSIIVIQDTVNCK